MALGLPKSSFTISDRVDDGVKSSYVVKTNPGKQYSCYVTGTVPHMLDPNIAILGKAGVGIKAGQDLHLSSQDTTTIASGQDTHWAVGGQMRIHTGQAIGMLAGAIQPGIEAAGKRLTMIAAGNGNGPLWHPTKTNQPCAA